MVSCEHDATRIVRHAAEPLVVLASAAHVRLAFEVEQEPVQVLGTEEALTEIARNLVENSIGHAPANSDVTIGLSRRGLLSIADRGPGIPKDQPNHLFERFWRGSWTLTLRRGKRTWPRHRCRSLSKHRGDGAMPQYTRWW